MNEENYRGKQKRNEATHDMDLVLRTDDSYKLQFIGDEWVARSARTTHRQRIAIPQSDECRALGAPQINDNRLFLTNLTKKSVLLISVQSDDAPRGASALDVN